MVQENNMIELNVIKVMCTQVSFYNVCIIMQQIHLSTLEKVLYFNVQVSGQDYNVHVH